MNYKIAVVTPYYKESTDILAQCHDSVLGQTYPCDHIVVSDGFRSEIFDGGERTLHVTLPVANGDNGNTPRGIGSLLADGYGYDAVAYLDADNWFAADHIAGMVAAHEASRRPVIGCKRTFHDLAGNQLAVTDGDEDAGRHVDTSCLLLFRPAFSVFRAWFMPKPLGPICDRVFIQKILDERLAVHLLDRRTVAFRTQYAAHYRSLNLPVPPGAKEVSDLSGAMDYLRNRNNINAIVEAIGFYPNFG